MYFTVAGYNKLDHDLAPLVRSIVDRIYNTEFGEFVEFGGLKSPLSSIAVPPKHLPKVPGAGHWLSVCFLGRGIAHGAHTRSSSRHPESVLELDFSIPARYGGVSRTAFLLRRNLGYFYLAVAFWVCLTYNLVPCGYCSRRFHVQSFGHVFQVLIKLDRVPV